MYCNLKKTTFRRLTLITTISFLCSLNSANAQDDRFEDPPTFKASEVLPEDILKSPYHEVQEEVSVVRYGYQFTLETPEGTAEVWSKEMLNKRIRESAAIKKLNEISQTDAFVTSISEAAKKPLAMVWNIASNPVSTVTGLPGGVSRYLKGGFYKIRKTSSAISRTISKEDEEAAEAEKKLEDEKDEESLSKQAAQTTSDLSKQHLGFNRAKRTWAQRMKVDPYSDNQALQKALERIAWATSLGSFAGDVSIPSYSALDYTAEVQSLVWETPPIELERMNEERLKRAGLDEDDILDFHEHKQYNISAKTAITLGIEKLKDVKGVSEMLKIVMAAEDIFEATMMIKLTAILSNYHTLETPLNKIEIRRGLITAVDEKNILIFPIAIEYLYWTPLAQEIAGADEFNHPDRELWITGNASAISIEELLSLNWTTRENCFELFKAKEVQPTSN
ncbi:MAG: hypothetical protein O7C75_21580 [Verrucomicrobia bacterium]|nr:hypothetical protein [Verrucomicrobiota bacterium]